MTALAIRPVMAAVRAGSRAAARGKTIDMVPVPRHPPEFSSLAGSYWPPPSGGGDGGLLGIGAIAQAQAAIFGTVMRALSTPIVRAHYQRVRGRRRSRLVLTDLEGQLTAGHILAGAAILWVTMGGPARAAVKVQEFLRGMVPGGELISSVQEWGQDAKEWWSGVSEWLLGASTRFLGGRR